MLNFLNEFLVGFGQQQAGTTVKFNPPAGQDTMVKNGVTQNINTKHQCITAMKEYEGKSLEASFRARGQFFMFISTEPEISTGKNP